MSAKTVFYYFTENESITFDLLELSVKSLRKVSDCDILVLTDQSSSICHKLRNLQVTVFHESVFGCDDVDGRMLKKVVGLHWISQLLPKTTELICCDVDTYFKSDPFKAFSECGITEIGLTSRDYLHQHKINAGVVFFKVCKETRSFILWMLHQIKEPHWDTYIEYQKKFNHKGTDWYVDQDFYNAALSAQNEHGYRITVVPPKYNYCPHCDGAEDTVEKAKKQMRLAYLTTETVVLHLKSRLKELVTEGLFEE